CRNCKFVGALPFPRSAGRIDERRPPRKQISSRRRAVENHKNRRGAHQNSNVCCPANCFCFGRIKRTVFTIYFRKVEKYVEFPILKNTTYVAKYSHTFSPFGGDAFR